ncbi:MAG: hypothetical protein JST04_03310 [Bdellovibrionales bacterium]|nr:hypothetical protein [Bdellovibrionales bacterium]
MKQEFSYPVYLPLLIVLLVVLVLASVARAATPVSVSRSPLEVDRGRIYTDLLRERPTETLKPQAEVGVSTWRPRGRAYSDFTNQTAPQTALRLVVPGPSAGPVALNGVAGFGYLGLTRTEAVTLSNGVETTNERQISILELPLGFELAPKGLAFGRLSAFAELGALPTLFVFGHSLDEDGHSNGGLGAYGDLGALYNFGGPRFDAVSLVATAGYRTRISGDVDTAGFAARFGVRLGL